MCPQQGGACDQAIAAGLVERQIVEVHRAGRHAGVDRATDRIRAQRRRTNQHHVRPVVDGPVDRDVHLWQRRAVVAKGNHSQVVPFESPPRFESARGKTLTLDDPCMLALVRRMLETAPEATSFADLEARAVEQGHTASDMTGALLALIAQGSTEPRLPIV